MLALAAAAAVFGIATAVQAAIPDAGSVIHGCYLNRDGSLRVIDTGVGQSCNRTKETPLNWRQNSTEPKGATGATGPTGTTGPAGPTGPSGSDPSADAFVGKFGTNTNNAGIGNGPECVMGQIWLSASPILTSGGVPANGQLLSIVQHDALFSLLGFTYGGNGQTTFALPDLRGLAPNNMTYTICIEGIYPAQN
jgi:tail collar domain